MPTTKTAWLDWLEAGAARLQERYRQAWNRLPHRNPSQEPVAPEEPRSKPWCTIHAKVDRQPREIVVHLELPVPHTVEADVRVIGSTLAIAVLRHGSGIQHARVADCYRRAIPLPEQADPGSAVHKVHGDELVIRMQPKRAARRSPDRGRNAAAQPRRTKRKDRANQIQRDSAQVTELPVGPARRNRSDTPT